jgi:uncharacterized protein YcbK (DUF882 family)
MTKCYLSPRETCCSCGCGADIRIDVRDKFNRIRERFGKPLTVSGPTRCPAQNKKVGGAANSRHMHGDALDIYTVGFSDMERIRLIAIAVELGATGIGVHKQFTHIDFGHNELTVWEY